MHSDLSIPLPVDKFDIARARKVVAIGLPNVEPILPTLFEWTQDLKWPVAHVLCPFLSKSGAAAIPSLRFVLSSTNDAWKYAVLYGVVKPSRELCGLIRPELVRLATTPTIGEITEGVDQLAVELLARK